MSIRIDISAFFEFVKKGVNPLVDFKTFEARKAALDEESEEQEPEYAGDLPKNFRNRRRDIKFRKFQR